MINIESVTTMLADRVAKKDSNRRSGNIREQQLVDQLYKIKGKTADFRDCQFLKSRKSNENPRNLMEMLEIQVQFQKSEKNSRNPKIAYRINA
jgi:hypothetical protein